VAYRADASRSPSTEIERLHKAGADAEMDAQSFQDDLIRNKMRLSDAAAVGRWALTRAKNLHPPSMDSSEHI
jgi:hypothetical protein